MGCITNRLRVCVYECTLCMTLYVCTPNTVEGNKNICDALSLSSGTVIIEFGSLAGGPLVEGGLSLHVHHLGNIGIFN